MDHDDAMRLQGRIEPAFIALAEQMETAGHLPADVAEALLALAMARVGMVTANGETEAAIARARATVERPS